MYLLAFSQINYTFTPGRLTLLYFLLASFLAAFVAVLLLTPLMLKLAYRFNILDHPESRKVHSKPVARLGGVGIYLGFLAGTALGVYLIQDWLGFAKVISGYKLLSVILIATFILFLLGIVDDVKKLSAKQKFLAQVIVSIFLFFNGVSITFFKAPFGSLIYIPIWLAFILTILWLSGVTNALNLTDGLDGLLSGIVIISGTIFFIVAFFKGQYLACVLLAPVVGACLGFLPYNFHPARIFMGDSGSLFLGSMFAIVSVIGAIKSTVTFTLFVPLMILAYPLLDTLMAIIRRIRQGKSPFHPDRGHLHHQLLTRGWSQTKSVLVLYLINIVCGLLALWLFFFYGGGNQ